MKCDVIDLGILEYKKALDFQKQILARVQNREIESALILLEHYPVFTIGRSGSRANILRMPDAAGRFAADIIETDRGGDITFHGPGQIVAYPILNLCQYGRDLHKYMRKLEQVIINTLSAYRIHSFRTTGKTGCFCKNGKIASIGISVSRWVTYHGLALNANTDLDFFKMINPCGFKDMKVCSIKTELKSDVDMKTLKKRIVCNFEQVFVS